MSGNIFIAVTVTSVQKTAGIVLVEIRRSGGFDGDVTILHGVTGDTILNDSLTEATEVTAFALIIASVASLSAPRTSRISILDDEEPSPPPPTEPPLTSLYDAPGRSWSAG